MHDEFYPLIAARQASYWWNVARRELSVALLSRYGLMSGCRFLDLGCGTGQNLRLLDPFQPRLTVGVDLSPLALELAAEEAPDMPLVQADVSVPLPFRAASFDIVAIFNVMYHKWIKSEMEVLREAARVLDKNGLLLVTEPAFPILKRPLDDLVMTRKRYRISELAALCETSGFHVLFSSYFTSFGFPILLALKAAGHVAGRGEKSPPGLELRPIHPLINATLLAVARLEAHLMCDVYGMPFGTTLVCVAKKRDD